MDPTEWSLPLEEEAMKKELEWLLGQEFTSFASLVQNQLRECVRFITRTRVKPVVVAPTQNFFGVPSTPTPPPEESEFDPMDELDDPLWITIETPGKAVEARFSIEGWLLKDGKLGIRTPKFNKGAPFVTTVNQPWKFTQLHNAHNYLVLALDQIHDVVSVQNIDSALILRSIDKIQHYLKLANDEFTLNRATSPKSPQSLQVFKPSLPNTLNVQFEIVSTTWVTTVYVLDKINPKLSRAQSDHGSDDGSGPLSGMEIIDTHQKATPSRKLETISSYIHNLNQLCCEFREKLVVLSPADMDDQSELVQALR
jgi:hypothetical protein